MKRSRWPTSSRCSTSSLSAIRKFMFVAARSANRPGSETFILRIAGTSSGMRSTSSASVSAGGHDARDEIVDLRRIGGRLARRRASSRSDTDRAARCSSIDDAPQSLQRDLHRVAGQIDSLVHARRDADASEESLGVDRLVVIATRDDQRDDQSRLVVRAEQREILGRPHLHGDRTQRVDDRGAKRHQRQRRRQLGLEDVVFALGFGHGRGR